MKQLKWLTRIVKLGLKSDAFKGVQIFAIGFAVALLYVTVAMLIASFQIGWMTDDLAKTTTCVFMALFMVIYAVWGWKPVVSTILFVLGLQPAVNLFAPGMWDGRTNLFLAFLVPVLLVFLVFFYGDLRDWLFGVLHVRRKEPNHDHPVSEPAAQVD